MIAIGVLLLGACSGQDDTGRAVSFLEKFRGAVVADEPRAVLIAEAILDEGGTAADAGAALFFALSVTYPIAAGLGAGGACVVYDSVTEVSESIEFLPRPASLGGSVAIPGAVRGFAAIHARFGRLRWSKIVLPAERLAQFGHPVSRAFATRVAESGVARRAGPRLRELIAPNGQNLLEGTEMKRPVLASTLSDIRSRGGGDLYFGALSKKLIDSNGEISGTLTDADLQRFLPEWKPSSGLRFGDLVFYSIADQPSGGVMAGTMWGMLLAENRFRDSIGADRAHLFAEVAGRVYASIGGSEENAGELSAFRAHTLMTGYNAARHVPPPRTGQSDLSGWSGAGDDGSTSFAIVDRRGSAIACGVSMNGAFGIGRIIPEVGFAAAASVPPGPKGWRFAGSDFLTSAIIVNNFTGELIYAGGASGGPAAPIALAESTLDTILTGSPLIQNTGAPRLFHFGNPDRTFIERGWPAVMTDALLRMGHTIAAIDRVARVNGIACVNTIGTRPDICEFVADPRGYGLGVGGAL